MNRSVNEGFSGGEKKRNEILQMSILEPKLAILDETDSGLDIDALRIVAGGVNALRSPDRAMVVITHHQRLLDYIVPDRVHVMAGGRIVRSGDKDLALELEEYGYSELGQGGMVGSSASVGATRRDHRDIHEASTGARQPLRRSPTTLQPSDFRPVVRVLPGWRKPAASRSSGRRCTDSRRARTRTGSTRDSDALLDVPFERAGAGR